MKKSCLFYAATLSLLVACGDEITEVTNVQTGIQQLAAGEEMGDCTKDNAGEMLFVTDSSAVYYCADGKWQSLNGKDGADGNPGKDGDDANSIDTVVFVTYDTVTVVKIDSLVVRDTVMGLNGASCFAEKINGGYKILCGKDSVGFVLNGSDGADGKPGSDGKDACGLDDDGEGVITITCGSGENLKVTKMFKAFCKGAVYDPANKECVDFGLLKTCVDSINGAVEKNTNGSFYTCGEGSWKIATEEEIVVGKACQIDGLGEITKGSDGEMWTCRASAWDKSTELELSIGKSCTSLNQGEGVLLDYSNWVCRADSIGWIYDFANLNFGSVLYQGKAYTTIGIGTQMWFAENLNYATMDGNADNGKGSWCYGNNVTNCSIHGRLYTWAAAMNLPAEYNNKSAAEVVSEKHQGVCPDGWHVPSNDEWNLLGEFVGKYNGGEGVGTSIKGAQYWPVKAGVARGSDKFGFNALASGYMNPSTGKFITIYGEDNASASFITATELDDPISMYSRDLSSGTDTFNGINDQDWKILASSLRCIKD